MEFKDRLRELRAERNLTQKDIADSLFLTKMAICHWEKGNSEPNITQLKTLARMFDVSIDILVGFRDY